MSIEISRNTVRKLTHESSEIRLRALEQVESKIIRAFAHNHEIYFKPGELCKQLIRWFGYQPLQAPCKVLDVLARILRSKYGFEAIERLGLERFKREMSKVQKLLDKRLDELKIVQEILTILQQHAKQTTNNESADIIELMESLAVGGAENTSTDGSNTNGVAELINSSPNDYEVAWSKASIADFNSMKFLADILINPLASSVELQNSLQHLQITMGDYPAEYLLQAPNIYLNLLKLFEKADEMKCPLEDVATTLLNFLHLLKKRLSARRKCTTFAPVLQKSSQTFTRTQLKVEKALNLLLQQAIKHIQQFVMEFGNDTTHLFELITSALNIYRMMNLCVDNRLMQKLHDIANELRVNCERDDNITIHRIKYVLISFILHDMAQNNANYQPLLNGQLFQPVLKDFPIRWNFAYRREKLVQLLCKYDPSMRLAEHKLKEIEENFATAITWLKEPTCMQSTDIIARSADICMAVEKLKSTKLTELLFNAIVDCNPVYPANDSLRQQATQLLQRLLQLRYVPLKTYVYNKLAIAMKKHFACLMNGECYCAAIANNKLLACQIVGVPLSTTLLQQLITDSHNTCNDSPEIQQHCIDLLCMLLKAQHLFAEHWSTFLEILIPILPLLQACTHSSKLIELLLKLYDPDAQHLPFLTTLQGNIGFLFHSDITTRNEAITRIIYTLNSLETAHQYLPNIMEISDLIPSDLCYLQPPREFNRIFAHTDIFSELSTLHTLLTLLDSTSIEPLIRKTTLMQINVMCQDWKMTEAFCDESALFLVLRALENSMQKQTYTDYTDAAIPAIGILCKALFYDTDCRRQLAKTANVYVLLLRALMLYQHDIQVRQDASICLMQLLYANVMVVLDGSCVQLPAILANLQLPLRCEFLQAPAPSCADGNDENAYADVFSSPSEEISFLRYVLAINYCNDAEVHLNQQYLVAQKQLDFSVALQLTERDWRLWKATVPAHNLKRCLKVMVNATEHRSLINAATMLKLALQLHMQEYAPATPKGFDAELFAVLSKYLHLPPGNEMDFLLYERLLELSVQCVRLPLPAIIEGINNALQSDYQHAFLMLLKNPELPLRLFAKICRLLTLLLWRVMKSNSVFYSTLFELLFKETNTLFERRDLQRVRCLLTLLQVCSMHHLDMSDQLLHYYCKRFLNLSIAIKAFTQTGAQWQRDCLKQICQLHSQMNEPHKIFTLNASCIKYLSGLCGHNDADVRHLAWCILANVVKFRSADVSGATVVIDVLSYLPGGFLACCLSTLLDGSETMCVRQLAGGLYANLLTDGEEACILLEQHAFFNTAYESLPACHFDVILPQHFDYESDAVQHFINCEVVSVYCHICIKLLRQKPDFIQQLCEKPFMCKLYELLKLPPMHDNPAYYEMCADICHLYSLCYEQNFAFLQRTLCRDQVWMVSFCQLLYQPSAKEANIVQLLQLLLILSKDAIAYEKLCEKFAMMPEFVVLLFMRALDVPHVKTQLQQSALAVLTVMVTRNSQAESNFRHITFVDVLEMMTGGTPREPYVDYSNKENETTHNTNVNNKNVKRHYCPAAAPKRKEPTNVPLHVRRLHGGKNKTTAGVNMPIAATKSAEKRMLVDTSGSPASIICNDLIRLFNHVYTTKACKFITPPSACTIQITESLGAILQHSTHAQTTAQYVKLFDSVLRIFNAFFDEMNVPCSTFVRRYGESRKMAIIKNFQVLIKLLHNWYSSGTAVIANDLHALELTKVLIKIWPWLVHSADLKLSLLQLCDAVSQTSTLICQKFSALISNYVNSVLQLIIKIVVFETTKVKAASSENFPIIQAGMRVLNNCCACADGRTSLLKERILDTFDGLYPFNSKAPKQKPNILHAWLQFWEVLSSYSEGAKLRNLKALCTIIQNLPARSQTRLYALRILRNMCNLSSNRTQLMGSEEFLTTFYNVLAQPIEMEAEHDVNYSYVEQMIVTIAIGQLMTGSVKYVAMVRGSKLEKKFRILREHLQTLVEEDASQLKQCEYSAELMDKLEDLLQRFNSL